ncbi:MAG: thermonuclease family protein [Candidatus Hydrogenedentes bacterium]|nr:thermonuclease family protein [Candidatus Hydrogenedentota bacterium]
MTSRNPHTVPHEPYFPPYWSPNRSYQAPSKKKAIVSKSEESLPDELVAEIVDVYDGDTMTARIDTGQQIKIRLYGVDCPEKNQVFGKEATQFSENSCMGKSVHLQVLSRDRYGRYIVRVNLRDSVYFNLELLSEGLAHWDKNYAPNDAILREEEVKAKAEKKGLWALPNPVSPSDFRNGEAIRARRGG